MYKFTAFLLIIACFFFIIDAQLTFTSSWGGKRGITATLNCKNDEGIAAIYKMIQNEAERLLLCQKN